MNIRKIKLYERQAKKLVKNHQLTTEQIEDTENLFKNDPFDKDLRPHKITCKKDKRRRSITVINTAYRILYTDAGDTAIFQQILDHDDYDRINKNC